jgi:hypothetical protein
LVSTLDTVGNQSHILSGLILGKRAVTHYIRGCMGFGVTLVSMENPASPEFESQTIHPVASNVLEYQNEIKTKFTNTLGRDPTSKILANIQPVIWFPTQTHKVYDIYLKVYNFTCYFN